MQGRRAELECSRNPLHAVAFVASDCDANMPSSCTYKELSRQSHPTGNEVNLPELRHALDIVALQCELVGLVLRQHVSDMAGFAIVSQQSNRSLERLARALHRQVPDQWLPLV